MAVVLVKIMHNEAIRGVYYLRIREKTELNLLLVVVLVLESVKDSNDPKQPTNPL